MPRSRAYWKGFLRLSLVTIGVHVHNAIESKSEISFRQIHKPTGRRVNYQKIVQGAGSVEARGAAPSAPLPGLATPHTPVVGDASVYKSVDRNHRHIE